MALPSRVLMTTSKPAPVFTGVSTLQHFNIGITSLHKEFILPPGNSLEIRHTYFLAFKWLNILPMKTY
jgi:hypothetical protein